MKPPSVQITGGAPTEVESAAVEAAIIALWREEMARASRDAGMGPWVLAARLASTGRGRAAARGVGRDAWRSSGRLGPAESHLQPGRGDAR